MPLRSTKVTAFHLVEIFIALLTIINVQSQSTLSNVENAASSSLQARKPSQQSNAYLPHAPKNLTVRVTLDSFDHYISVPFPMLRTPSMFKNDTTTWCRENVATEQVMTCSSSVTDLLLNTYSSYLIPSTLHGGKAESPFQTRRAKRRPLSSVTVVDDFLLDALEFRNYAISQPFYEERIEGTGKKYK